MACVDDDEYRAPLFKFRPVMASQSTRQLSSKDMLMDRVMNAHWRTENNYIPFKRTNWHPIGCTRSHAFAMLQMDDVYSPVVMDLVYRTMVRPSQRMASSRGFSSPWTKYSDTFSDYLGGCAHNNLMCIVLASSVILMTSEWHVELRDNTIALQSLVACTMNDKYLVVFGVEAGKDHQSMFVYNVGERLPRKVLYRSRIEPTVVDAQLLKTAGEAMFVQCENGRTRRIVIDKGPNGYTIRDVGDLKVCSARDVPLTAKEMQETRHLVQIVGKDAILIKPGGSIERSAGLQSMIVDIIDYQDNLIVCHDADNSIHFFDENLLRIATVPWEHIASAVLLYENGVPSIVKPYSSMSRCLDDPSIIAVLTSFGALVTIKIV